MSRTACRYWRFVITPVDDIARSTCLRLARAARGFANGSYCEGACGRPASSAACASVSSFAGFEKYVCAAASTPYAWLP